MLPFVAVLLTPRLLACQPVDVFLCRCCYSLATGTPHDRVPDRRGWVFSSYLLPFSQVLYASKSRAAPLSHPEDAPVRATHAQLPALLTASTRAVPAVTLQGCLGKPTAIPGGVGTSEQYCQISSQYL